MVGTSINLKIMFMSDKNPENLLKKFHSHYMLGKSAIPPFWAMGYHQCRWGY